MFEKTEEGRKAIQTRHVRLTPCQRAVLITVNGSQSSTDLAATAAKMGGGQGDVSALIEMGLIAAVQTFSAPQPGPQVLGPSAIAQRTPTLASADVVDGPASGQPPISMDSLWPESMNVAPTAREVPSLQTLEFAESMAFDDEPDSGSAPDFGAAKAFVLELLQPLGLRAIQLRRTVEATHTPAQLRDVEPLIRALLNDDENAQLDSAFFGL